ncbi:hypothetical protein L7834_012250 [Providencia rettgeri]|uniref:hypothetical protein n=1 Tax=Providencia rettgeri TaxID=587 RepID=UPI001EE6DF27|nr:hypothetical protein [Providencia rettgeri]MCG5370453.1 hypothetical protein [Providencia rettgeri]
MSDKKEIATLSIKISVDSTDLDKLEAQLKRIEGLMVSTGLKEPTSVGFSADKFFITNGQVFIDEVLIPSGAIKSTKTQGSAIDDAMQQAVKEGARKGVEQAQLKVTVGVNYNDKQPTTVAADAAGTIDKINEAFHNSGNKAFIAALEKAIDINIPVSHDEFTEFKQQVESEFSQLQASITAIQQTIADSDRAIAESLRQLNLKLCGRTVR